MNPIFIAEIKTQSPFGFKSPHSFMSLMQYAITYGDWISVHTNALWGGDIETLSFVRRNTNKPILAKGFHFTDDDIKRSLDHGADYVLLVDRVANPAYVDWDKCLFEIHNHYLLEGNLSMYPEFKKQKFVFNSRDLGSGLPKKLWEMDMFTDRGLWTCQASGIYSMGHIQPKANAFIVGEHLVEFCKQLPRD